MTIPIRFDRFEDCPDVKKHTRAPTGYIAFSEWTDRMARTHDQLQCPTCGFWTVWKRRITPSTDRRNP